MNTRIFAYVATGIVSLGLIGSIAHAADSVTLPVATTTVASGTTTSNSPLMVSSVSVQDANTLSLSFNQNIATSSVRVRIINQATQDTVSVQSITGSTQDSQTVMITTSAPLVSGNAYTLNITSAISTDGTTINAGVDAIREFTVPSSVSTSSAYNAPNNPNAVMTPSATTGTVTPPTTTPTVLTPMNPVVSGSATAQALPVTGASSVIVLAIAAVGALIVLGLRRRRAQ